MYATHSLSCARPRVVRRHDGASGEPAASNRRHFARSPTQTPTHLADLSLRMPPGQRATLLPRVEGLEHLGPLVDHGELPRALAWLGLLLGLGLGLGLGLRLGLGLE